MKKIIISAIFIATASFSAFAQSNTKGTIHVGLGWGVSLGGANIKTGVLESDGVGAKSNYGIRASYGLGKAFSLGIFLRKESAIYVSTFTNSNFTTSTASLDFVTSGIGTGLEGKVYAVNKDKFNLYFAPSLGFSTGKAYYDFATATKTTLSGLNYGLTAGFNWYWASFIGMSLDLGYSGASLSGKFDGATDKTTVSGGGFYFGLGLVSKFGGE